VHSAGRQTALLNPFAGKDYLLFPIRDPIVYQRRLLGGGGQAGHEGQGSSSFRFSRSESLVTRIGSASPMPQGPRLRAANSKSRHWFNAVAE